MFGYIIIGIILGIVGAVLIRTLMLKPTAAKTVVLEPEKSERATEYGKGLAKMIQDETISSRYEFDEEKFHKFHKTLEELFPLVHSKCEIHNFDGSLLYKWSGKSEANPILFMSHQDVVEATGEWEHGAFSGDIDEEGNVWGRGTVDTKGSLFCIFTALEELMAEGYEPECDVYIGSSCSEEWSGPGAPATVDYLEKQGVKLALVMDEGGMILDNPVGGVFGTYGMVGVVEKGYGDVKFIAHANGGHASAPKKNSPLVRLGKFMADVEKNYPFKSYMSPTVEEMFTRMAPNMGFGMRLIFANLWLFKPLLVQLLPAINSAAAAMVRTTIGFTTAKGSDGLNVMPQTAFVTGNMRYIQHQPMQESIDIITARAKKFGLETELIYAEDPFPVVDYQSDAFHLIEAVAAEVYPGVGIAPYCMTGGTDSKFYTRICDNCLRFAPIYINNQQYGSVHGLNENINQGHLPRAVEFYKTVILKSKEFFL